jgi:hypothetical protein
MSQIFSQPFVTLLDSNGNPVSGGTVQFLVTGTTTPASVYSDSALSTPNANPAAADSAGRLPNLYLDPNVTYRVRIFDAAGALIRDVDPITSLTLSGLSFVQSGAGATASNPLIELRRFLWAGQFGVTADGSTDDTAALLAAIEATPAGGTLRLPVGEIVFSSSIVLEKPIRLVGGGKEETILSPTSGGSYIALGSSGQMATILALHSSTVVSGHSGDARRTVFEGLTIQGNSAASTHGFVAACPVEMHNVDSNGHALAGFAVIAEVVLAGSAPILGNANGSLFINCIAQNNGASGFYLLGNDANACTFLACKSPDNGDSGFYDDSLLGNTYVGCEADGNDDYGFFESASKPIRGTYIGCYSETAGHFSLNPRSIRIGAQGSFNEAASYTGVGMVGLPSGRLYMSKAGSWAATQDIAESRGDSPNAGAYMEVSSAGFDYNPDSDGPHIKLNNVLNPNDYVDLLNGTDPVLRFPARDDIAGNVRKKRAHMPEGFTMGSTGLAGIVGAGSAPPATGSYTRGAIWVNDTPAVGAPAAWSCTVSGSPGTWTAWANLA